LRRDVFLNRLGRAFFFAGLRAFVFADFFFPDLLAELTVRFLTVERPLLPKMFSQLSENFFVAPTRVTVITLRCSWRYGMELISGRVAEVCGSRSGLAAVAKQSQPCCSFL